jgi:hypothetical protein
MCEICEWEDVMSEIDDCLERVNDLPKVGENFGESCTRTLEGIQGSIERTEHVTDGQRKAVENISAGLARWRV